MAFYAGRRLRFPFVVFLGAHFFLTFPYPVPVAKNCAIFIGCNFESLASQVRLQKQKKDTASVKEGKVSLLRRGGQKVKAVL